MNKAALQQFLAELGDIPVATDPGTIKLKSRDFFWFSPILKPQLDDKRAFAIVRPRDRDELTKVVSLAARRRIALTMRGGGTGNYGQCVPLDGGIVLDMTGLDRILEQRPGLVKVEAGKLMLEIDRELKPTGWELRVFPSTRASATIGGFVCGGAGGVGAITWGQIGDPGAVQAMTLLSMEETPRIFTLEGPDTLKAVHAYGVNGVVLDVTIPTAPRQDWAEAIVTFDSLVDCARFAQALSEDQIVAKKLVTVMAPGISTYFKRLLPYAPADKAFAIVMVSSRSCPRSASMRGLSAVPSPTRAARRKRRRPPSTMRTSRPSMNSAGTTRPFARSRSIRRSHTCRCFSRWAATSRRWPGRRRSSPARSSGISSSRSATPASRTRRCRSCASPRRSV